MEIYDETRKDGPINQKGLNDHVEKDNAPVGQNIFVPGRDPFSGRPQPLLRGPGPVQRELPAFRAQIML
jgi:hypothetical protein